ncbi:MAG: hypothetical protein ABFR62_02150 [Bacteroidota bacterium]
MNKKIWIVIQLTVVLVTALVFSPLVIPANVSSPELFGMPYTLWTGIIAYLFLVALNFIGAFIHSKVYSDGND